MAFAQRMFLLPPRLEDVTVLLAKKISQRIKTRHDWNIVEIICWWHDVQIPNTQSTNKTNKRVAEITAKYLSRKFTDDVPNIIFDSIKNHEWGSHPKFVEGKILQDADKLELLSPERFRIALDAVYAGLESKDKFNKEVNMIKNEWLPLMLERYNFDFSRRLHNKKLPVFLKFIETISIK